LKRTVKPVPVTNLPVRLWPLRHPHAKIITSSGNRGNVPTILFLDLADAVSV
jgi:hypothetical protein